MLNWILGITTAIAETAGSAAPAAAEGAAVNPVASMISTLLFPVLMLVVFYFLLIRPQKKKDKKVKDMLSNLKVGDRICTIGGIYGTIAGLREDNVILKVGEKDTPIVVARWAIRNVEAITVENDADVLV